MPYKFFYSLQLYSTEIVKHLTEWYFFVDELPSIIATVEATLRSTPDSDGNSHKLKRIPNMQKVFIYGVMAITFFVATSFHSSEAGDKDFSIVISKHAYKMKVLDADNNLLIVYPVVFGNNDLGDKMVQGDRKTPEGVFHIISKRVHEKWRRFMMLDYPNADSYKKFNERKAEGLIPKNAEIGGGIGIHGTWPHEEFAIDRTQNWTLGCISTKNAYIDRIYQYIPVGTQVTIEY